MNLSAVDLSRPEVRVSRPPRSRTYTVTVRGAVTADIVERVTAAHAAAIQWRTETPAGGRSADVSGIAEVQRGSATTPR